MWDGAVQIALAALLVGGNIVGVNLDRSVHS